LASSDPSLDIGILPFELDGHRFGVFIADVQEVLRAATASPLPRAPSAILGVINVRGVLVPVFDIRGRFGLRRRPMRPSDTLILVQAGGRVQAIVAELVSAIVHVPQASIEQCRLAAGPAQHVAGVAKLEDGNLIIYDLESFLSDTERAELDAALDAVSA
jgi:purine-binding chemotaxis protein CheW